MTTAREIKAAWTLVYAMIRIPLAILLMLWLFALLVFLLAWLEDHVGV